jgi:hypothetical protein
VTGSTGAGAGFVAALDGAAVVISGAVVAASFAAMAAEPEIKTVAASAANANPRMKIALLRKQIGSSTIARKTKRRETKLPPFASLRCGTLDQNLTHTPLRQ